MFTSGSEISHTWTFEGQESEANAWSGTYQYDPPVVTSTVRYPSGHTYELYGTVRGNEVTISLGRWQPATTYRKNDPDR